jgi:hypothetical protein
MKQAAQPAPDKQAQRERGAALRVAGWLVLLANLIVLFYMPAAQKLGRERPYEIAIAALIVVGVSLILAGSRMRRAN